MAGTTWIDLRDSNAAASHVPKSGGARTRDVRKALRVEDRTLIHRALSLATLSIPIVGLSDADIICDGDIPALEGSQDLHFAPGMSHTPRLWTELYDDAAALVKAVDFLGTYSEQSLAVLDAVSATGAWIDDDGPESLRRSKIGTTNAYLADLLLQAFLAWQARAILVLCEADCHVLADIANFLVEGNRPRPLPIPDLRATVLPDRQRASGKLPNLKLERIADVEAARRDANVQALAQQLRENSETPGLHHDAFIPATLPDADSPRSRLLDTDDLMIRIEDVKILGNEGVQVALHNKALVRMSLRRFAAHNLRLLLLLS